MQNFLPYSDFRKTAKCLDYRRLGKQRVEAWQIYKALTEKEYGWKNHPIVKMWKGYEKALFLYGWYICQEWRTRQYNGQMWERFIDEMHLQYHNKDVIYPSWLGNKKFHASHRSNLLRKDKKYYSQFGWKEKDNLPYVWLTERKKDTK